MRRLSCIVRAVKRPPNVIDAQFEVISGPTPVRWQPKRRKPTGGLSVIRLLYGGLICLIAGYTLLLGLAGADLDTRDSVQAWRDRQPAPITSELLP